MDNHLHNTKRSRFLWISSLTTFAGLGYTKVSYSCFQMPSGSHEQRKIIARVCAPIQIACSQENQWMSLPLKFSQVLALLISFRTMYCSDGHIEFSMHCIFLILKVVLELTLPAHMKSQKANDRNQEQGRKQHVQAFGG